jgi:hypothetical protein
VCPEDTDRNASDEDNRTSGCLYCTRPLVRRDRALGRWFAEIGAWSLFGTYTFRPYGRTPRPNHGPARVRVVDAGPSDDLTRRCWDGYARRLSRLCGRQIGWFVAFEPGRSLGRPHIHALLCDAEQMPAAQASKLWKHGRSTVEPYDHRRGAPYYVSKFAGREFADWDVGGSLVRRRG